MTVTESIKAIEEDQDQERDLPQHSRRTKIPIKEKTRNLLTTGNCLPNKDQLKIDQLKRDLKRSVQ
jgi:hypothetical protein